mmetsp:Transcript_10102/g.20676  ORF Transcript_10102/g.20676 Transcript_10102/m.20676 type:complete len:208 (+) Transcript_10102:350-973(+)
MIRTRKTLQGGQRTPTCSNEHDTLAEHEHNQVQSLRGNSTRGSPLQCELAPDMIGIRSKQQFRRNPKLGKARSRKAVCSMTDLLSSQTGGASCGTAPNSSGSTSWVSVLCKEACSPMKHTLTPSAQKMVLDRLVIIMVTKVMPPSAAFCSNPESVLLPNVRGASDPSSSFGRNMRRYAQSAERKSKEKSSSGLVNMLKTKTPPAKIP